MPVSRCAVLHSLVLSVTFAGSNAVGSAKDQHRSGPRPNVLFLLSDDQRPDTIRALGNKHIQTPHLDDLVRRGTVFTRAVSPWPLCSPSRAEIMTGCTVFRTKMGGNVGRSTRQELPADLPSWARTMRDAGYHTWYVGKWHSIGRPSDWGYEECQALFGQGDRNWPNDIQFDWKGRKITGAPGCVFQTDDGQLLREKGVGSKPDISAVFADATIDFIRRKPKQPFFLHVNVTAPHDPLFLPPGYEGRYKPEEIPAAPNFLPEHPFDTGYLKTRDELLFSWPRTREAVRDELAMYYLVISYMDEQIGRILAALQATGQAARTIVIFTSDHGIAIGSHGLRGKQNMYEHTIGVPLIVAGPGIRAGIRCDAQCYLRDLYATACDLTGIEVPKTVQGSSLVPLLRGETAAVYPCTFAGFGRTQRMIRTDRWKLIHYPKIGRFQLFDLSADPHEVNDLAANSDHAAVVADLRAKLEAWQKDAGDPLSERR